MYNFAQKDNYYAMKVYFNNSCKICRSEINIYKKENVKDIDWVDITNNSQAEKRLQKTT